MHIKLVLYLSDKKYGIYLDETIKVNTCSVYTKFYIISEIYISILSIGKIFLKNVMEKKPD